MSVVLRSALLSVVLTVVICATAQADYHYAGERDVTSNPFIQRVFSAGQGWWSKQGVTTCGLGQGLHVLMAPDLDGAEGRTAGCTIWILQFAAYNGIVGSERGWWSSVAWACNIAFHELAHTPPALLTHPTADHPELPDQYAPYEQAKRAACRRFADRVTRHGGRR